MGESRGILIVAADKQSRGNTRVTETEWDGFIGEIRKGNNTLNYANSIRKRLFRA